jgi:hypothetical protein
LKFDCAVIAKAQNIEERQIEIADDFSIEKARLRSVFYPAILSVLAIIEYGWVLEKRVVS